MKLLFYLIASVYSLSTFCQSKNHNDYLVLNRKDLTQSFHLEFENKKIIGFGALHGSAKTEETEILLIQDLVQNPNFKFYFPETDFSTANHFQKYIDTGDEELLKDLIYQYRIMVPQEGSIEMFNKWKSIRPIFKRHNIKVVGIDWIGSYKYTTKELVELTQNTNWAYTDSLQQRLNNPETEWGFYNKYTRAFYQRVYESYLTEKKNIEKSVSDLFHFNHLMSVIKKSVIDKKREPTMYSNYEELNQRFHFDSSIQLFRFGVFHIMKNRINDYPPLFTRFIEGKLFKADQVCSIQGFLTKSEVLWDLKYDKSYNYTGFTTKKGFGISDYWKEYYKGIKYLKKNKLSDITLFNLAQANSPYRKVNDFHLIETKMLFENPNWNPMKDKSTLDYIDFAILISNSKANTPIQELDK